MDDLIMIPMLSTDRKPEQKITMIRTGLPLERGQHPFPFNTNGHMQSENWIYFNQSKPPERGFGGYFLFHLVA